MTPVLDMEVFIAAAKRHGGHVRADEENNAKDRAFAVGAVSDYVGGCGSPGCNCSPGLWANATEYGRFVLVYFTNHRRGDDGDFTPQQHRAFLAFCQEVGIRFE